MNITSKNQLCSEIYADECRLCCVDGSRRTTAYHLHTSARSHYALLSVHSILRVGSKFEWTQLNLEVHCTLTGYCHVCLPAKLNDWVRRDKYDRNQSCAVSLMQNRLLRSDSRMSRSIMSNAALRSSSMSTDISLF